MDVVDEPRCIILAVSRGYASEYPASIIRLGTPPPPPQEVVVHDGLPLPPRCIKDFKYLAHVPFLLSLITPDPPFNLRPLTWGFPLPRTTSPEKLYMFPDTRCATPGLLATCSLPGISVNLSRKDCQMILPSGHRMIHDFPATVGDSIYFLLYPLSFARYNTKSDSWDFPKPRTSSSKRFKHKHVFGTAVLHDDDTILFNMEKKPLAYVVSTDEWYPVKDPDHLADSIVGQAVVVNNIIYAFQGVYSPSLVLFALNRNPGTLESFTCDLLAKHQLTEHENVVPSMDDIMSSDYCYGQSYQHLVHLGEDNFCVIHSCDRDVVSHGDGQYMQLDYIKLTPNELILTDTHVHLFEIALGDWFNIIMAFSLPNSKFNALEEGTSLFSREQEADFVALPHDLPQFMKKYSSKATTIIVADDKAPEVQEEEDEEDVSMVATTKRNVPSIASRISAVTVTEASTHGHSICVRNLPLYFRLDELDKELKKFGPFKVVLIHPDHSQMSKSWVAVVEFESATSKKNAIKGSPITIGGCKSVIQENSGSSLTQCDSNRTSCSSSSGGSKKVKNVTSDGHKKSRNQRSSKKKNRK